MRRGEEKYQLYLNVLEEELVPAMGCTEPIAVAYGAAKAREVLGKIPDRITIEASGSIIKNVKSVFVPNTDHLKGIEAAAVAGVIAGNADKKLEVIARVEEDKKMAINSYLKEAKIETRFLDSNLVFDLIVTVYKEESYAKVRIADYQSNIVFIEKDGKCLYNKALDEEKNQYIGSDRSWMDMESIWDFANSVEIEDVSPVLDRQIAYNMAIAEEGLRGNYGANIGKVLLNTYGNEISVRAKAKAAAGSDARMNGCELPVIINSGSGNQGITCSVPVIEYARELKVEKEKLIRALVLSNLTTIHQKTGIGTLSAYCGAVCAGVGAGAGIAYLYDGDYEDIIHTVVNALAIVSGIVCDGAKASCAAKIASSVDAALMGYHMYQQGQEFKGGDGIVMNNVESTIQNIGYLGKEGMKDTNEKIIKMMIQSC